MSPAPPPAVPTADQRLALRSRPAGRAVMRQRWDGLLFLHWRIDPERLRARLPGSLHLDLFDGDAWLGIVPFFMSRIRPAGLLPVPWLSWFLELNVRTYVHDDSGTPGVWFFSLDCNRFPAVEFARRAFHLPYEHARMTARRADGEITYQCQRKGTDHERKSAAYRYRADGPTAAAEPESLEFFLAERYLLYSAASDGTLCRGRVHHAPYQLAPAACREWSDAPARWDGFDLGSRPPESRLIADPVDVSVFPLRR